MDPFNHQLHYFCVELTNRHGTDLAILINNFQFWIGENKRKNINSHDGRFWTYNSVSAFQDKFSYWSVDQITRLMRKLIKDKILIKGNFNKKGYDRTTWYAFSDEEFYIDKLYLFKKNIVNTDLAKSPNGVNTDLAKSPNAFSEIAKPIPDNNSNNKNTTPTPPKVPLPLFYGQDNSSRSLPDDWLKINLSHVPNLGLTELINIYTKRPESISSEKVQDSLIKFGWGLKHNPARYRTMISPVAVLVKSLSTGVVWDEPKYKSAEQLADEIQNKNERQRQLTEAEKQEEAEESEIQAAIEEWKKTLTESEIKKIAPPKKNKFDIIPQSAKLNLYFRENIWKKEQRVA